MKANTPQNSGMVFDIQRGSLHDGPGIRTTVFLKGCPLHCLWCHNPEAAQLGRQLFFAFDRCAACGECAQVCAAQVHQVQNGSHRIDYSRCQACGSCVRACPNRALKLVGRWMDVSEVMLEVTADREFYQNSRGGLTLSGGEPLAQFSFSLNLLKAARSQGIHTCLETCGYAPQKRFAQIIPFVDLFLLDYKITGRAQHKQYTGVPNELILSNLDFLVRSGQPVILRCPIIPGINDTHEHFAAIQALNQKYPSLVAIEILPYHDMGNPKRTSLGLPMTLTGLKTTQPELAQEWAAQIRELGCSRVQIG